MLLAGFTLLNVSGIVQSLRYLFVPSERLLKPQPIQGDFEHERIKLLTEISSLKLIADENKSLRELLAFHTSSEQPYVVADVISYDPLLNGYLYIDRGTRNGVTVGQPVVAGEGVLVGKIASVEESTAVVELLTSDSSRAAVKALGEASTNGILYGYLGTSMRMEYIIQGASFAAGDVVVTSGAEPLVPEGLLIGTIQEINADENQLFFNAIVESLTDLSALKVVSVIKTL